MAVAPPPAAARDTGHGRQPAEVEQQRDLLDELAAQTHENRVFAERVAATCTELRREVVLGSRWDRVEQLTNAMGYAADRQISRLGSVVL